TTVRVRTPRAADLAAAVAGPATEIVSTGAETLEVIGVPASRIGDLAAEHGIPLHELTPTTGSLEEAYMALTGDAVEYKSKDIA
ncbi:MAG: ABC transporter ATP-binding protein, partial [Microbacterium sp.]